MSGDSLTWQQVVLAGLNVVQIVALAYIASRGRRVRKGDHEADDE